ncbi:MAG: DNA-directed RNA polymerase subunit N [Candidatus Aenigmatarchaeota archaeon]|nr:MAG: DNA-directed RNA polymerase subunit N [Candidatus Aenigmarchaeota archaeon]
MMIPVRCISCGKPVGHLWERYQEMIRKGVKPKKALDDLGLERYCCRSLFLTHVDVIDDVMKFKR